jgi:hypothetical protein
VPPLNDSFRAGDDSGEKGVPMKTISRRKMLLAISIVASASYRIRAQQPPKVEVYKDPTCGCCAIWVTHMKMRGFDTTVMNVGDIAAVKAKYHVPNQLRSCHTALVGGYVIEGHVPATDVQRLLKQRPKVVGLAVPGMPIGSPGMEGQNGRPYDVLTFDAAGKTTVFSTQQPSSHA